MLDSAMAAPGTPIPGGLKQKCIAERPENNRRRLDWQERLRLFDLADECGGVVAGRTIDGCDFRRFLRTAKIGDALQVSFDPPRSRRLIVSRSFLLATHRAVSEGDLTLIKGFNGEFFHLFPKQTVCDLDFANGCAA